jgi:RHS repeat-associated protein
MKRTSLLTLLLAYSLVVLASLAFGGGSLPDDIPDDCLNTNAGCCACGCCPPGGGGPGGSGGGGGFPRGGAGSPQCYNAPCRPVSGSNPLSSLRSDNFGPNLPVGIETGNYSFDSAKHDGEIDAGKFMVELRRTDLNIAGYGGFPIAPSRTYNNISHHYYNNVAGNTVLGPRWHFNYDMHIETASGASHLLFRLSNGGKLILYNTGTNVWDGDETNGAPLHCVKDGTGYTITQPNPAVVYNFDLNGKLTAMHGGNGNKLTFTNTSGRLTRIDLDNTIQDLDDRYVTLDYVTTGSVTRLWKITANTGEKVEYKYDVFNLLAAVCDRTGRIIESYMNLPATGAWGTDELVMTQVFRPDATGAMQRMRRYIYTTNTAMWRVDDGRFAPLITLDGTNFNEYLLRVTNNFGLQKVMQLNVTRDPEVIQAYESLTVEAGAPINQEFIASTTLPDWRGGMRATVLPRVTQHGDRPTTYTYKNETNGAAPKWDKIHVSKVTHADGTETEYEYDSGYRVTAIKRPLGRNTYYGYDSNGNKKWMKDPAGNTWYYFNDSIGRLIKTEDPTSGTTLYGYTDYGQVAVTTNTEGRATTYEYYPTRKHLLKSVTALGVTTTYEYDGYDYLTTTTDHLGNKSVTTYDYLGRKIAYNDPMGNITRYTYNTTGSLENVIDANDGWTTFTYDFKDRLVKFTDQRGKSIEYGYDLQGRKQWEKNPLNLVTTYGYHDEDGCSSCGSASGGGELAWVTDPDNRTTSYTYDIMGRLKMKTYSASSDQVEFFYDAAGRTIRVNDNRLSYGDKNFHYAYDAMDHITSETYPDNATIRYSFDSLGRRTTMIDPDANTTTYNYSNTSTNKKLSSIQHPFGGNTDFSYNSIGLLNSQYNNQNLTASDYSYDTLNRVEQVVHTNDNAGFTVQQETYTYNANSMRTQIDFEGRENDGNPWNPYHRLYSYDSLLRLTAEHKRWDSNNATAWRRAYTYDTAGNRTQMVNFDGTTTTTTNYTYNDFNQLISDGTASYYYDNNGNMSQYDIPFGSAYTYHNRENRLEAFAKDAPEMDMSYGYDYLGRRIERVGPDENQTRYYYDGNNVLMVKERDVASWRTKNVYMLKQTDTGQIIAERTNTAWTGTSPSAYEDRWYQYDLLGNVVMRTDDNGSATDRYEMEAFGNMLSAGQSGMHLASKENDVATNLYYFASRWYSANQGRFLELDPMAEQTATVYGPSIPIDKLTVARTNLNRYVLSNNNPVNYVDYSGGCIKKPATQGGKAATAGVQTGMECGSTCGQGRVCPKSAPPEQNDWDWTTCESCCNDCISEEATPIGQQATASSICVDACRNLRNAQGKKPRSGKSP